MDGIISEWKPAGISLGAAASRSNIHSCWREPRRSRIPRALQSLGPNGFNGDDVLLPGCSAKDFRGVNQFSGFYLSLGCKLGLLINPRLLNLVAMDFGPSTSYGQIDSAIYGDILADRWGVYGFARSTCQGL